MSTSAPVVLDGRGRLLPSAGDDVARVTLADDELTLSVGSETRLAPYRDLSTIAVQAGVILLVLGSGAGAERFLLALFGQGQGTLVRELRDRRFGQQLSDALVTHPTESLELLEYAAGQDRAERGVGILAYHPWGAILAPLDERLPWIRLRRGEITTVVTDEANGLVDVTSSRGSASAREAELVLPGLGERARVHGDRMSSLRRSAQEDVSRLVSRLMPDADYGGRQEAARGLIDGRPARPADLPTAWPAVKSAVLTEPTFASSYRALVARSGDLAAERALAMAPVQPGGDEVKSWFFVVLPGNLVALELVSEGAHATYTFRAVSRTSFPGRPDTC